MEEEKLLKKELFMCECGCSQHQMIITYISEGIVSVEIHLNRLPLHKRIWNAIKYIFGYRSEFGEFDEFIFDADDADKLQEVVNYLKDKQ